MLSFEQNMFVINGKLLMILTWKKCIVNLLEDVYSFKDLVDMLSFFVLQVTKKMIVYFLQQIILFFLFLNSILLLTFANMF